MGPNLISFSLTCQFFRDQTESFLSWFYFIFPPVVAGAGMSTSSMIKRIMFKVTSYTFKLPVTLSKFSSKTSHGNYQWHICKTSPLTNITYPSEFCKKIRVAFLADSLDTQCRIWPIFDQNLTSIWPEFDQYLMTFYTCFTNIWPIFDQNLIIIWPEFDQYLMTL